MMRLGAFTAPLSKLPLPTALDVLIGMGYEEFEIGTGGYPGNAHCDRQALLGDHTAQQEWLDVARIRKVRIGAFAVHGNPLHPVESIANDHDVALRETIALAGEMDIPTVVCFSGLPGTPGSLSPTWDLNTWPPEHQTNCDAQFGALVEYWQEVNALAETAKVNIAIEPHWNMGVHNVRTMLKLRELTGTRTGCNADFSHQTPRGVKPVRMIRALAEAECLFHLHIKETLTDRDYVDLNGNMDCVPFDVRRPWQFTTATTGDIGETGWFEILAALRDVEYTGMISAEHEDRRRSDREGMALLAQRMRPMLYADEPGDPAWEK